MNLQTLRSIADEFFHLEMEFGNLQYDNTYEKNIAEKLKDMENIKKAIASINQKNGKEQEKN